MEENGGEKFQNVILGKDFSDNIPKVQAIKENKIKWILLNRKLLWFKRHH